MGWFYFKIKMIKTMEIQLLNENANKNVLKCALLLKVATNNELCYALIAKNWMELEKNGMFEVHDNLCLKISCTL